MKVYLVQHGDSKSEMEDLERPLTEKGREAAGSVAGYLARLGADVAQVMHSGRLRASQTAELFANRLSPGQGVCEKKGLGPLDDPLRGKTINPAGRKTTDDSGSPFSLESAGILTHLGHP